MQRATQQGSEKIKVEDIMRFPWETEITSSIENVILKTQEELKSIWDNIDKNKEK